MENQMQLALNKDFPLLHRKDFPHGFVFGTAGSAYQYEGAYEKRGKNIWDTFCKIPDNVVDGSSGDVAVDFRNRYEQDVPIMKELGVDAYRFSISWSRILPTGRRSGGIHEEGVKYYNDLINLLLQNGIQPYVTLFHWDVPQDLQDEYEGFLSPNIVCDFCDYVDLCFSRFGDRVKHWITLNEPWSFAVGGYVTGSLAPGYRTATRELIASTLPFDRVINERLLARSDFNTAPQPKPLQAAGGCQSLRWNPGTEPYLVAHYQLLAHAAAVHKYKQCYQHCQKGTIGITLVTRWFEPYSESMSDRQAAKRALDFFFGWFMDPLTNGDYPESMKCNVGSRLPKFTPEESKRVKGSFDFLGLNYYTTYYAQNVVPAHGPPSYLSDIRVNITGKRNGVPIGPQEGVGWIYVYPKGIWELLLHIKNVYKNPIIYITENGVDEKDDPKEPPKPIWQARSDPKRIDYHYQHLSYVKRAINQHVNVKGYFAWALLDNFEWHNGYTSRFGIYYVDFKDKNLTRYPKLSSLWFKELLKNKPHC